MSPIARASKNYRSSDGPGRGAGFATSVAASKTIRDPEVLQRIRSLAIPPAWSEVQISPSPTARVQSTGRDARRRKQYIYHPDWRAGQERNKYRRILRIARVLPRVRRRVRRDLNQKGLGLPKVLATVISLLECSLIRIGNREYARENGSFGLTTLEVRHVKISSQDLDFHFRGKSRQIHSIHVHRPKLATIVRQCRELPGSHLFQYLDDESRPHILTSHEVNHYLREICGQEFSAKDFRTWSATVLMINALSKTEPCKSLAEAKRNVKACLASVSSRLGNTPAVCRKSYVHPVILKCYLTHRKLPPPPGLVTPPQGLTQREQLALGLLQRLLGQS